MNKPRYFVTPLLFIAAVLLVLYGLFELTKIIVVADDITDIRTSVEKKLCDATKQRVRNDLRIHGTPNITGQLSICDGDVKYASRVGYGLTGMDIYYDSNGVEIAREDTSDTFGSDKDGNLIQLGSCYKGSDRLSTTTCPNIMCWEDPICGYGSLLKSLY